MLTAKRRGLIRVLVGSVFLLLFGTVVFHWGWQGWTTGEIMIRPKGRQAYLAVAGGAHAGAFQLKVWTNMLIGGALILVGVAMPFYLVLAPRSRVDKGLVNAGLQRSTAGRLRVPGWLVCAVLVALFSALAYIALKDA